MYMYILYMYIAVHNFSSIHACTCTCMYMYMYLGETPGSDSQNGIGTCGDGMGSRVGVAAAD